MKLGGLDFPSALMAALRNHRLAVFAGAGVSKGTPACLPLFKELTKEIAQGTGEHLGDDEPEDRFLGRLQTDKRVRAAELLTKRCPRPTGLHRDLLRLFPSATSARIVTTNFDLLFEQAAAEGGAGSKAEVFKAPALPLGREFSGIVHVHGALDRPETMVLTDADFGRAYLTEGWARRFLVDLFRSFTVLFVGYSHDDIVMHYLARALPAGDTQRFVLTDETDDGRWTRLRITPIPFQVEVGLWHSVRGHSRASEVQVARDPRLAARDQGDREEHPSNWRLRSNDARRSIFGSGSDPFLHRQRQGSRLDGLARPA